ncbi:MAG: type VI secretion system tip protein VgrG [Sandaracinaceae bacterium]|nr:type VI secretion system tip protein VgrG [Sandaracinaceae bacterium]
MDLQLRTNADLGDARLTVLDAHGWERVSELYEYTVRVSAPEPLDDDALDQLINHPVTLALAHDAMTVHGVVKRLVMNSVAHDASAVYELAIGPRLSRLDLTRRSRVVAQDESHLDVIKRLLDEHSVPFEDQCQASYPAREYTVQHHETDLAFVLRLMQYNGIHFHFRQEDETETLVLGDRNAVFEPSADHEELRYEPAEGRPTSDAAIVTELHRTRVPRAASVVLREYDWRRPAEPLRAEAPADERTGVGLLDLFGEHWHDDADGRRLAEVRAQEHVAQGDVFTGTTQLRGLRPGMWFDLSGHPAVDLNRRYLVLETAENVSPADAGYCKHFTAIPFDVVFRPERTVPRPRLDGLVQALVDGESRSTATPIDDAGRYRVVLPLDGAAQAGGLATRWVRRAQPYAGEGYGMHLPLHVGVEVAVAHVNGDPDRPIILGAVPNRATESPVTSGNATAGVIRTGSGILIEMDDDA